MAINPFCEKCQRHRKYCNEQTAHKRNTAWVVDWKPSRNEPRIQKTFGSDLDNPKELAESQLRGWKTDRERGTLRLVKGAPTLFGPLADKYWLEHASVEGRKPERSTFYTVELAKGWIGIDRKVSPLTDDELKTFQNDMRTLQRKLRAEGLAGATVNRYFNIIRSIFERGREWGLVKVNPIEFVGRVQEDEPAVRFLEQKEINHLFETAAHLKDEEGKLIEPERIARLVDSMTTIFHTGARPSSIEECSFDNGDVDFTNRVIWFTTYKGGQRKKHRYPVPMDDAMMSLVMRRAEVTGRKGLVFDTAGLRELQVMAIEQSKINEHKPENQRFTMYGLKHCYASHLLMRGATMDEVGALLGHTDGRMVRKHYGHLTIDHLRKIQDKINQVPAQLKVVG